MSSNRAQPGGAAERGEHVHVPVDSVATPEEKSEVSSQPSSDAREGAHRDQERGALMENPTTGRAGFVAEARVLAVLASPIVLANLGHAVLGGVDTYVAGRLGREALGAAGLGNTLVFAFGVFGMGIMHALDPLVAQARGAGENDRARDYLRQALYAAVLSGIPITILAGLSRHMLELVGVAHHEAGLAAEFANGRLPSLIPFFWAIAFRNYLQAAGHPRVGVISSAVANVINVPLAFGLTLGKFGFPALGLYGAGLAGTIAVLVQLIVSAGAAYYFEGRALFRFTKPSGIVIATIHRVGVPIGLQFVVEVAAFSIVFVLMARCEPGALGAHQIAIMLASGTFMVPMGIGAAVAVRVGDAVGMGDHRAARHRGLVGSALGMSIMLCAGILFGVFPEQLVSFWSNDPDVLRIGKSLVIAAAFFQVFDGAQTVFGGGLRGAGQTTTAAIVHFLGYYAVGLPFGLWLAQLGGGPVWSAEGLWWGLTLGLGVVAFALAWRFFVVTSRPIKRADA